MGLWPYGERDFRNGGQHDPSKVILIPAPVLIDIGTAEWVMAKLTLNDPRTNPAAGRQWAFLAHVYYRLRFLRFRHDPHGNEPARQVVLILQRRGLPTERQKRLQRAAHPR
jgi:hypothetical protein